MMGMGIQIQTAAMVVVNLPILILILTPIPIPVIRMAETKAVMNTIIATGTITKEAAGQRGPTQVEDVKVKVQIRLPEEESRSILAGQS